MSYNNLPSKLGPKHYVISCIERYISNDWTEYYKSLYLAFVRTTGVDLASELDEIYELGQGENARKRKYRMYIMIKPCLYHLNELVKFRNGLWHPWGYPIEAPRAVAKIYYKYSSEIDDDISTLINTCESTMASLFMDHYDLEEFSVSLESLIKNGFSNKVPEEDDSWM